MIHLYHCETYDAAGEENSKNNKKVLTWLKITLYNTNQYLIKTKH